jgi:hypothetical protein
MPDTNYVISGVASRLGLCALMEDANQARTTSTFGIRTNDGNGGVDPFALCLTVTSIA